ncbi:MAG: alginate export family protein [Cellvibrionaceae bacterium]|nr:alginate export family protein [Cellvibrionaceae bacterium]
MKMPTDKTALALALLAASSSVVASAEDLLDAKLDMRLRYENVQQDNALKDADGLTLRTRLSVSSKEIEGFSAHIDIEDSRKLLGVDDFKDTVGNGNGCSVIPDPETTEVDQAYIKYKAGGFSAKLGRQVITRDGQRFIGHVGFRQDRQSYDGLSLAYQADGLSLSYAHISKRNRIFAEQKDLDAKDHLFNLSYKTEIGKLVAYGYLLELDQSAANGIDTYGLSFSGKQKFDGWALSYAAEYATQSSTVGASDYDTSYTKLELGAGAGGLKAKLGYEVLGSDDGNYGFATPLATLHKFNGWTDQFLGTPKQGLQDIYITLGGKAGGGKWLLAYHDFAADQTTPGIDDLGSELGVQFVYPFAKRYSVGLKYAQYSAGDAASNKVDTDKLWLWLGAKF